MTKFHDTERTRNGDGSYTVECFECGRQFTAMKYTAAFCSSKCRTRNHRRAGQLQKLIQTAESAVNDLIDRLPLNRHSDTFDALNALHKRIENALSLVESEAVMNAPKMFSDDQTTPPALPDKLPPEIAALPNDTLRRLAYDHRAFLDFTIPEIKALNAARRNDNKTTVVNGFLDRLVNELGYFTVTPAGDRFRYTLTPAGDRAAATMPSEGKVWAWMKADVKRPPTS